MVANMWKNSLKNVESDNNKILYENLLDFFYSEMVLTYWISIVIQNSYYKKLGTVTKSCVFRRPQHNTICIKDVSKETMKWNSSPAMKTKRFISKFHLFLYFFQCTKSITGFNTMKKKIKEVCYKFYMWFYGNKGVIWTVYQ